MELISPRRSSRNKFAHRSMRQCVWQFARRVATLDEEIPSFDAHRGINSLSRRSSRISASQVMQIAIEIENPFNFADVDHDLDAFSKKLHDETLAIARQVRGGAEPDLFSTVQESNLGRAPGLQLEGLLARVAPRPGDDHLRRGVPEVVPGDDNVCGLDVLEA